MDKKQKPEEKNSELEECKVKCEDYLNNWKRERADFINYKKEEVRRVEDFVRFANESLILEIIDSMDDLYVIAKNTENPDGIGQAIKNFEKTLAKYGVEKIKVEKGFDPLMHEALETEENGVNLQEVRTGWLMHGKVIRPTRVKINK